MYQEFANVYDALMEDVPYEEWCELITQFMDRYGVTKPERGAEDPLEAERNLVVDLGCGTGTFTRMLYRKGYDMIGVDNSQEMLSVALQKKEESGDDILYLHQDMRSLELYSTVGTVISVCDSLNYILEEEELLTVFKLVRNYLYPGGLFIFDFNTVYKYETLIGEATIAENRDDVSFIWENYYSPENGINEYDLTLFIREEEDLYRRVTETHFQRGYTLEQMLNLLDQAELTVVKTMDGDTFEEPGKKSGRIFIVLREESLKKGQV